MRKILSLSAIALTMALTSMPLATASAEELNIQIGPDGPKIVTRDRRCDPDREYCGDRRRSDEWRSECSPNRALDKAERMGLRRVRVVGVGRRTIEVRGITRSGDRASVVFARRDPRCPVLN
jgi:hypothetical protein